MPRMNQVILGLALILVLTACGRPYLNIKEGMTTEQVRDVLGDPYNRSVGVKTETWTYLTPTEDGKGKEMIFTDGKLTAMTSK